MASVDQVAKAMNITPRRVHQLVQLGMPHPSRGQYALGECLAWYIRFLQNALEARSGDDSPPATALMSARTRQAFENANRLEAANLKARGEVMLAEDAREQQQQAIAYLEEAVAGVPDVATDPLVKAKLEDELARICKRFADGMKHARTH